MKSLMITMKSCCRRNSVASTTLEAVNPGHVNHAIPHYGVHLDVMGGCHKPERSPSSTSNISASAAGAGGRKMSSYQTVKLKINNAGAILKEGEGRTAKISLLVILLVGCCWSPTYCFLLAEAAGMGLNSRNLPAWMYRLFPLVCGTFSVTMTPLLYGYRSRRIQQEIKKCLGLRNNSRDYVRKNPNHPHELRRMKSFSCPHLLVSAAADPRLEVSKESTESPLLAVKKFLVSRIIGEGGGGDGASSAPGSPTATLRRYSSNASLAVRKNANVMKIGENVPMFATPQVHKR